MWENVFSIKLLTLFHILGQPLWVTAGHPGHGKLSVNDDMDTKHMGVAMNGVSMPF